MPTFVFHAAAKNGALHFQEFERSLFFFPRATLPFVSFFPTSSRSSAFIGLIMQTLKYQQGSDLSASALRAPGRRGGPPPLPVLAPRHRRAIVSAAQMRFARLFAWITHAGSGNPEPSRLPPGSPGTFCLLPPRRRLWPPEFP